MILALCLLVCYAHGDQKSHAAQSPGRIYVVYCSDTAVWGGLNVNNLYNTFNITDATYTSPSGNAARVMQSSFRLSISDSLGNPVKFTWFMMGGCLYSFSLNSSTILALDLMLEYHGDEIAAWGDELSYHYHTWEWSDPNSDTVFHWNQAPTFSGCEADFEFTVAHMIIDHLVFFSTFRSGWNTMDNYWQNYLDDLLPYRMENWSPNLRLSDPEPVDNIYDWSRAPLEWVPYHPSKEDYQVPGTMRGWEARCMYNKALTQSELNGVFAQAAAGIDQVMVLWSHLPEADFPEQITALHNMFVQGHALYPTVEFEYCTGIEAMQKWRKTADTEAPEVGLFLDRQESPWEFVIRTDEAIYQRKPFVAYRAASGIVSTCDATSLSQTSWQFTYDDVADPLEKIGIGVCDLAGNPAALSRVVEHFTLDTVPNIAILLPNAEAHSADAFFPLVWECSALADAATVSLYYDSDAVGLDGTLIASMSSVSSGEQMSIWDTSLMPPGSYYVYGIIDDGRNPGIFDYSDVALVITHATGDIQAPLPVTDLAANDAIAGEVQLTWSLPAAAPDDDLPEIYLIYRARDVPVDAPRTELLIGAADSMATQWTDQEVSTALYYYAITTLDEASNESSLSNQAVAMPVGVDRTPPCAVVGLSIDSNLDRALRLSWSTPPPASDSEFPDHYEIYRATSSPLDYTDLANRVHVTSGADTGWTDTNLLIGQRYYYVVRSVDTAGNRSAPSGEVSAVAGLKPVTFQPLWAITAGGFSQNSIRRIIYNRHTGHVLLGDVDDDAIHMADATTGAPLGNSLSQPAGGWSWLGPYGLTIDDAGVIYANQYAGNDAIYRWQSEDDEPTTAISPMHTDTDTRGVFAIGTGSGTEIFAVADDNVCRIYTTDDGLNFTLDESFATSPTSAQHGIWVSGAGDEIYCTKIGSDPAYFQRWVKSSGSWVRDTTFAPAVSTVDSVFKASERYLFVANYGANRIQALDPYTGYLISGYALPGSSSYPSMGLYVDVATHRIFWSRRGIGYGCVMYNSEEVTTPAGPLWVLYE